MTGLTVLQQIEISKELGNLFRQCRIEAGDTIEKACVKMGVTAKSVETLEDGRYERWFGKSLGGTIRTFAVYNKKLCFSLSDLIRWPSCNGRPRPRSLKNCSNVWSTIFPLNPKKEPLHQKQGFLINWSIWHQ